MSAAGGRGIQRRRARAAGAWQLGRSDCLQLYYIKLGFPQLECRPRERKKTDCCVLTVLRADQSGEEAS